MAPGDHPGHCLDPGVLLYLEGGRLDWKGKIKKYREYLSIKKCPFCSNILRILEVRGAGCSLAVGAL